MQAQKEIYVAGLISDRNVYIEGLPGVFRGIGSENPLADLDACVLLPYTPQSKAILRQGTETSGLSCLIIRSRINR
jgi:hypothetical protein